MHAAVTCVDFCPVAAVNCKCAGDFDICLICKQSYNFVFVAYCILHFQFPFPLTCCGCGWVGEIGAIASKLKVACSQP